MQPPSQNDPDIMLNDPNTAPVEEPEEDEQGPERTICCEICREFINVDDCTLPMQMLNCCEDCMEQMLGYYLEAAACMRFLHLLSMQYRDCLKDGDRLRAQLIASLVMERHQRTHRGILNFTAGMIPEGWEL